MVASISIVPASGSVVAVVSACRVTVAGAQDTDSATYDTDELPREESIPYRLVATASGEQDLVSHEFNVSADGDHVWDNVIFPDDGSWTISLIDQRDDSVDATLSVTVVP